MAVQVLRRFVPPPASDFAPLWPRRTFVLTGMTILAAAGYYEMYPDYRHCVCTAPSVAVSGRSLRDRMIELMDLLLKFGCEVTQVLVRNAVRELTRQPVALGELI